MFCIYIIRTYMSICFKTLRKKEELYYGILKQHKIVHDRKLPIKHFFLACPVQYSRRTIFNEILVYEHTLYLSVDVIMYRIVAILLR